MVQMEHKSNGLWGSLFNIIGLDVKITVCLPGGIDSSHFLKHFQNARLADRYKNNGIGKRYLRLGIV